MRDPSRLLSERIAWLLRYVAGHGFGVFVSYRVALALVLSGLLLTGTIAAS